MEATTARKLNARPVNTLERQYQVIQGKKKNRARSIIRTGLFLSVMLSILIFSVSYYLSLQASISDSSKNIARMEKELNELKLDNDENYSRITSGVNLDEIRKIAIQELGMQYADEEQIVSFNGEGSDYFRQTGEIPE